MADYLKKHTDASAYTTWAASNDYVTPNVSLVDDTDTIHYNPYVAPANNNEQNNEPNE